MIRPLVFSLVFGASPVAGQGVGAGALDLPVTARLTAERVSGQDRYDAPIAAFDGDTIPTLTIEGPMRRQAYEVPGTDLTPLQVLAPLRDTLQEQGFEVLLDCVSDACGGFDFRFETEVFPAPAMFVALQDFHFLTLVQGARTAPEAVITLLASTTREAAYLQIIQARREGDFTPVTADQPVPNASKPVLDDVVVSADVDQLLARGAVVLSDVDFASGETALDQASYPALDALARLLADNPNLRIALVGHTDSVGALDGNIAISRARARAVRSYMIAQYDIDPARMEAEGMGYLAPRASNLTPQGREANRRVEAIVLSAQ